MTWWTVVCGFFIAVHLMGAGMNLQKNNGGTSLIQMAEAIMWILFAIYVGPK